MGRNPFLTYSREYINDYRAYLETSTLKEHKKKLRYLGTVLNQLKMDGRVETANPKKITEEEIKELILWMREDRGLHPNTQVKYLQILGNLLRFCGNTSIDVMRSKRRLPKSKHDEINSLSEQEVEAIINAAARIGGWNGEIARFFCTFYPYTGLRPSELRLAKRKDLNENNWTIKVTNPKGKNSYGRLRTVPIPSPIRLAVQDFLQIRKEYLESKGIRESELLIPRVTKDGDTTHYSSNHFKKLKRQVQDLVGIEFKIKDFRASYAQILKDREVNIESVSKALGHSSTEVTEIFYARIKDVSMMKEINNVWLDKPDVKKSLISDLAR